MTLVLNTTLIRGYIEIIFMAANNNSYLQYLFIENNFDLIPMKFKYNRIPNLLLGPTTLERA
jgi:hypothetical protein